MTSENLAPDWRPISGRLPVTGGAEMDTQNAVSKPGNVPRQNERPGLPGWIRFLVAVVVINGSLNAFILNFIIDHRAVPYITAGWMAIGYARVFRGHIQPTTFKKAFTGVLMSLGWPLLLSNR